MGNSWKTASNAVKVAVATRQLQNKGQKRIKSKKKQKKVKKDKEEGGSGPQTGGDPKSEGWAYDATTAATEKGEGSDDEADKNDSDDETVGDDQANLTAEEVCDLFPSHSKSACMYAHVHAHIRFCCAADVYVIRASCARKR